MNDSWAPAESSDVVARETEEILTAVQDFPTRDSHRPGKQVQDREDQGHSPEPVSPTTPDRLILVNLQIDVRDQDPGLLVGRQLD